MAMDVHSAIVFRSTGSLCGDPFSKTKQKNGSDHACGYRLSSRSAAAAEVLTLYFGVGEVEQIGAVFGRIREGGLRTDLERY